MKKILFSLMAAIMIFATSCENDLELGATGKTSVVSFSVESPEMASRAYSDGLSATKLQYAVYEGEQILPALTELNARIEGKTTVNLQLTTGNTYTVIFWAAAPDAPYSVDFASKTMTVDYSAGNKASNAENRDAFYAKKTFTVTGSQTETIELRRPFAQLNIGTADYVDAKKAGYEPKYSGVKVKNVYTTLDLWEGKVDGATEVMFDYAAIPVGEEFPVSGYDYMSMNYLLVASTKALVDIEFGYTETDASAAMTRIVGSVPVQRNYRTNIFGQLLTSDVAVNVVIDPIYEEPAHAVTIWDGKTVENPTITETEVLVANAAQWIGLKGKSIKGKTIKLTADLDFGGYDVKGLGFTGTFDAQGHIMQNMTLKCGGSYYSNGLFQGDASGEVTVKNLTIKNVVAECADPNQGYVGTIFGDVQNNVTLENVHVYGADLCGVQSVGGLIGFVASGKTATLTNCSVNGSYIHNYAVENESGFVAGLVGRPVGTVNVTNCEVNNTKVEGFYAARRGEASIAAAVGNQNPTGASVTNVDVVKYLLDAVLSEGDNIQTALQAGKTNIYLKAGNYEMGKLNASGIEATIIGESAEKVTINGSIQIISSTKNFKLKNVTFEWDGTNNGVAVPIELKETTGLVSFENCVFKGTNYKPNGNTSGYISMTNAVQQISVIGCTFDNCASRLGIWGHLCGNPTTTSKIINNKFLGGIYGGGGCTLEGQALIENVEICNNNITGYFRIYTTTLKNAVITGNNKKPDVKATTKENVTIQ